MNRRIHVGQHVRIIEDTGDGLELEGQARLRPGQLVDLVLDAAGQTGSVVRRALVLTWAVARLGQDGTTYQGVCRWQ